MSRQVFPRRIPTVLISVAGLVGGPVLSDTVNYETPSTVSTADVLPAELLRSDYHTVDDNVRSDGYLNYYRIRSDYGDFEAASTTMLCIRIRELGALAQLDEVSKTEARFFVESVLMLAWYHRNEQSIIAVTTEMTVPIGVRAGGSTIALLPTDHVYWTESIAQAAGGYSKSRGGSDDQTHDLWLAGTVSARGRRELAQLGWDVRDSLDIMSEL